MIPKVSIFERPVSVTPAVNADFLKFEIKAEVLLPYLLP
ncbi:MAG: hypothetical protein JWM91_4081 [Rhodospirillales bacterium]|nr:hypothetical protein [Rhodospirillales bacterium]